MLSDHVLRGSPPGPAPRAFPRSVPDGQCTRTEDMGNGGRLLMLSGALTMSECVAAVGSAVEPERCQQQKSQRFVSRSFLGWTEVARYGEVLM